MNRDNYERAMNAPIAQNGDHNDHSNTELPISMIQEPWQWIGDLFYLVVQVAGYVLLGALILIFLMWATGLHRVLF
jgi:hypothetical protein